MIRLRRVLSYDEGLCLLRIIATIRLINLILVQAVRTPMEL